MFRGTLSIWRNVDRLQSDEFWHPIIKRYCRAALNSRNCLQDDELLQLNPGILDSQCT